MRFTRGSSASLISESQTEEIAEDNRETEESETESISAGSEGPKPKKFRSDVWDFFTKVPGGKKVLCGLCKNEYSYLGATSNLREHLLRYHKEKYKRNESGSNKASDGKEQTSMDAFFTRSKCPPSRAKKITELIAFMVAKDLRPAAVVDGEGFKRLLSYLEPGYVIPSSVHIMDVIRRKYTVAKEKLKRILAESGKTTQYSLTTDIWTSFANDAYISLTVHFIDECWELRSYTLTTYPFPEQHTGDNIVEKLKEVVGEYEIDDNSIFAIVHDQGSNFQRAGRLLEADKQWNSLNCAAHCLQLCVIEGLGINAIAQALAAAKALVKHFHHSARATEELRKKQESMNQPTHKLVNECKTRWNSTFYMCQSLLQNRWPVSAVIADESVTRVEHRRLDLSNAQWELLGDLVKILHPLEIGTTHLCSESTSSISSILPVLFGILKHLEVKEGDSTNIRRFKMSVESQIKSRWDLNDIASSDIKVIAAALDPRYKALKFLSVEKICEVKTKIRHKIQNLQIDSDSSNSESQVQPSMKKKALDILFGPEENDTSVRLEDEVDLYFSETCTPRNSNPLVWWKANSLRYPRLSKLVKPLFAIPATSTSSERLFSVAGLTVTRLRSSLSRDNVNALIFLHNNYSLLV